MIEDDELRAIFLSDFAEPEADTIRVTPDSGEPFDLPFAIFDLRPSVEQVSYREGARVSGAHPKLQCRTSEFPASLMGACTVRVRGIDYNAYDVKPDGTGMTCVELRRK